jgi:hypothetical protein
MLSEGGATPGYTTSSPEILSMDLLRPDVSSYSILHSTLLVEDMGEWKDKDASARYERTNIRSTHEKGSHHPHYRLFFR